MKPVTSFLLAATLVIFTGCAGYHPGASKPHQLAAVRKLAVPTFKNDTLEPRIEVLVTDAVIKKLQMDGSFKIVPVSEADAVLKGTITDITRRQMRARREDTLVTSEILVGLIVKFSVEATSPEILAASRPAPAVSAATPPANVKLSNVIFSGTTRDSSNIVVVPDYQLSVRQALADAAERFSSDIVSQLTVGW
ncbi:MAG: LPS assembly lipoprotein LptE [Verrucomicrobiaceae bacterium]